MRKIKQSSGLLVVLCTLLCYAIVWWWQNRANYRLDREMVSVCRMNLRHIRTALMLYCGDYGGYPTSLEVLCPDYLNADDLHCPLDFFKDATRSNYRYIKPDETMPDTYIVVSCERHFWFSRAMIWNGWRSQRAIGTNIYITKKMWLTGSPKKAISTEQVRQVNQRYETAKSRAGYEIGGTSTR